MLIVKTWPAKEVFAYNEMIEFLILHAEAFPAHPATTAKVQQVVDATKAIVDPSGLIFG